MTTEENMIAKLLLASGMTVAGASGVLGNLYAESAMNPKNLQNTYEKALGYTDEQYTNAVDNGKYGKFASDSAGYGLAQWTYGTRKAGLLKYAKTVGKSVGDAQTQIEYLIQEMQADYYALWQYLCNTSDYVTAACKVLTQYERPADMSDSVQTKRANYAKKYYEALKTNNVTDTATTSSKSGTITIDGVNYKYTLEVIT